MIQRREEYGAATGRGEVRLERLLPGPVERVWSYLTDSDRRGTWLAPGEMELRVGGAVELRFRHADLSAETEPPAGHASKEEGHVVHGTVTRCDPPRLLAYTWDDEREASEVTFELTPRGDDVLLVVTHRRLPDRGLMVGVAAGWHAHLGLLLDRLEEREPRGFWSTYERLESEYAERFEAAGAEPPPA